MVSCGRYMWNTDEKQAADITQIMGPRAQNVNCTTKSLMRTVGISECAQKRGCSTEKLKRTRTCLFENKTTELLTQEKYPRRVGLI